MKQGCYLRQWESFWKTRDKSGSGADVLWDAGPEYASMEDLNRFLYHMNPDLPILDLGCGNGRQTRFLAKFFKNALGVDISPSAIQLAIDATIEESNVEYRVLDILNLDNVTGLHDEFGDLNIYMRAVFHQIQETERALFVTSLRILLGEKGTLYQIEPTPEVNVYLRMWKEDIDSISPKRVLPPGFNPGDREVYYPKRSWMAIEHGRNVSINTIPLSSGEVKKLPASYLILRARKSSNSLEDNPRKENAPNEV